jgi:hypothetical protein
LSFGSVACRFERDRKGSVSRMIRRRNRCESKGGANGLLHLSRIA